MIPNLKTREMVLVYCVAGFAMVWLMVKIIFGPFHEKLGSLHAGAQENEEKLRMGLSLLEKKALIDKEYGKYATYFSLQRVSDEEAVAAFLKEVEKVCRESGVTILDMKPQKEAQADKFSKQYFISIKAEGNMRQLVNLLYSLHNSPLLFSIEKLVLSPKSESASDLNITMTLVGVSFL